MNSAGEVPVEGGVEQLLSGQRRKGLLRFLTCGSVDDGKSTLIGRLLYEANLIFEDQLAALASDSKKHGTQGEDLDFALLMDGLVAEREQGITIDVAYRFFSTEHRKYIVADTPGHEQYTRNMATGASTADAAIILVDARIGVLTQTRRHSFLVSLMGVRNVAFAINKMDLEEYSQARFRAIEADCRQLAQRVGIQNVAVIPVSALKGDNIVVQSAHTPWYSGDTVMSYLEGVDVDENRLQALPFRFPVQWVNRPNLDFRGYAGTIASGMIRVGDRVRIHPSGRESTVARIVTREGDLPVAVAGQSPTLTLNDEIDISRGDLISNTGAPAEIADQFEATVIWMDDEPMLGGRRYLMKIGPKTVTATPSTPKYKLDVNTFEHIAARGLAMNEIGVCNLSLDHPIAFDPYAENRETGSFVLIDRITNRTTGAGLLHFALRRAHNIHLQALNVDRAARGELKGQKPCIVWLTGLSGAGKSTIANILDARLFALGRHTYLLDGDNVRHGLNRDLGFTDADRVENIRRIAEVAKLLMDAGLIVIVSFISPFRNERRMARELVAAGEFIEVFVDAPIALAEQRDPKGLYEKARRGELKHFTGIDSPYEIPEHPEIRIETSTSTAEDGADGILRHLAGKGIIHGA